MTQPRHRMHIPMIGSRAQNSLTRYNQTPARDRKISRSQTQSAERMPADHAPTGGVESPHEKFAAIPNPHPPIRPSGSMKSPWGSPALHPLRASWSRRPQTARLPATACVLALLGRQRRAQRTDPLYRFEQGKNRSGTRSDKTQHGTLRPRPDSRALNHKATASQAMLPMLRRSRRQASRWQSDSSQRSAEETQRFGSSEDRTEKKRN